MCRDYSVFIPFVKVLASVYVVRKVKSVLSLRRGLRDGVALIPVDNDDEMRIRKPRVSPSKPRPYIFLSLGKEIFDLELWYFAYFFSHNLYRITGLMYREGIFAECHVGFASVFVEPFW